MIIKKLKYIFSRKHISVNEYFLDDIGLCTHNASIGCSISKTITDNFIFCFPSLYGKLL